MKRFAMIMAIAIGVLSFGLWPDAQVDRDELFDRVWISEFPEDKREKFDLLLFSSEQDFGIAETSSSFQGDFDVFSYTDDGTAIRGTMLQEKQDFEAQASISRCNRSVFDYCLKIEGLPRGSEEYGSKEEWRFSGSAEQLRGTSARSVVEADLE